MLKLPFDKFACTYYLYFLTVGATVGESFEHDVRLKVCNSQVTTLIWTASSLNVIESQPITNQILQFFL